MKSKYNWVNHFLSFLSVILGVYLAFYINEKAKSNEDKKESLLLMQVMVNDLSADIKTYEAYQIPINVRYEKGVDSLLILLSSPGKTNEVNNQLSKLFQVENYLPSTSTYNSIKSSGKIRLFKDLKLQQRLSNYYDGLVQECMRKNEVQVDFFMNELLNWLTIHADLIEMKLLSNAESRILSNKLMIYKSLISQKIKNYGMIVEESKQLKIDLETLALTQ